MESCRPYSATVPLSSEVTCTGCSTKGLCVFALCLHAVVPLNQKRAHALDAPWICQEIQDGRSRQKWTVKGRMTLEGARQRDCPQRLSTLGYVPCSIQPFLRLSHLSSAAGLEEIVRTPVYEGEESVPPVGWGYTEKAVYLARYRNYCLALLKKIPQTLVGLQGEDPEALCLRQPCRNSDGVTPVHRQTRACRLQSRQI